MNDGGTRLGTSTSAMRRCLASGLSVHRLAVTMASSGVDVEVGVVMQPAVVAAFSRRADSPRRTITASPWAALARTYVHYTSMPGEGDTDPTSFADPSSWPSTGLSSLAGS